MDGNKKNLKVGLSKGGKKLPQKMEDKATRFFEIGLKAQGILFFFKQTVDILPRLWYLVVLETWLKREFYRKTALELRRSYEFEN